MKSVFRHAASAAVLAIAAPIALPAAAQVPTPAHAPALPSSAAVEQFYSTYRQEVWFRQGAGPEAASQLAMILRRAPLDGLSGGPELAGLVGAAVQRAATGDPAAVARAERLLSAAWVLYVQALRRPTASIEYGDTFATPRTLPAELILSQAAAAPSLSDHLRSAASVNPIYAQLRDAAWAQMQQGVELPRRLIANLDRARALPWKGRYIVVDVATQHLMMMENDHVIDQMKVIVGQPSAAMRTPLVASTIHYATFNPYWHVPPRMVRKTITRNVLRLGEAYLRSRGYEVVDGYTDSARVLSSSEVDWKAVADGRQEVWVRQLPGRDNAMGRIKFNFPNSTGIYLHDTPQKELFAKSNRALSAGCIRLEDANRLAAWLLGREPIAPSADPELHVKLPQGVPVYVTYLTARADGGQLTFADDVYGLDVPAMAGGSTH